jgi:hypothetical protein
MKKRRARRTSWAWRGDAPGAATIFTGKAELGQGIKTALLQIAVGIDADPGIEHRLVAQSTRKLWTGGVLGALTFALLGLGVAQQGKADQQGTGAC